jgi:outer membrane phospholipase A
MKFHGWVAVATVGLCVASARGSDDVEAGRVTREAEAAPRGGLDEPDTALAEFARHFSGHEPIYILAGTESPNVKFQVSFKYAILNPQAPVVQAYPALAGVNIAYTQTSLWDTAEESAPFFDSSYKPELLWSDEYMPALSRPGRFGLGLQFGVQHESNGKGDEDSRNLNVVYVRPILTFGDPADFHVSVAPRVFTYFGGQWGNPDIEDYRGYADLRVKGGWRQGLEVSALGRLGDDWDRGSIQVDVTYPLRKVLAGNFDVYLDVQGFYGYGETLREYNERTTALRVGIAVVR